MRPATSPGCCETALAMAEIDYENKDDPSIFVKFPVMNPEVAENGKEFVLVWTTTPWTLPANMAVCVHPDFDYAYVKVNDEVITLEMAHAKQRIEFSKWAIGSVGKKGKDKSEVKTEEIETETTDIQEGEDK